MQTKKLLDRISSKNLIVDYAMRYVTQVLKVKF